jgi:serine protease Do
MARCGGRIWEFASTSWDRKRRRHFKLPPRSGVLVADVLPGGSADDAGLRINDVITEFAGRRVRGPRELQDLVEQKPVDSQQTLAVMRRGELVRLQVTLKPYPLD